MERGNVQNGNSERGTGKEVKSEMERRKRKEEKGEKKEV